MLEVPLRTKVLHVDYRLWRAARQPITARPRPHTSKAPYACQIAGPRTPKSQNAAIIGRARYWGGPVASLTCSFVSFAAKEGEDHALNEARQRPSHHSISPALVPDLPGALCQEPGIGAVGKAQGLSTR